MFEASHPFGLFDYFRVPYQVRPAPRRDNVLHEARRAGDAGLIDDAHVGAMLSQGPGATRALIIPADDHGAPLGSRPRVMPGPSAHAGPTS